VSAKGLRFGGVKIEPVGLEQVRGDDLCDFVLAQGGSEVLGGGEVLGASVALRQRLVGDAADDVLEEAVLTVLRRPRIRLQSQQLLSDEAGQERLQLRLCLPGQRGERGRRERLSEHCRVLDELPLLRAQAV
jgi:hypothetical protein